MIRLKDPASALTHLGGAVAALLMTPLLIVFLAIGILVGAFGGAMAIRNYLKV